MAEYLKTNIDTMGPFPPSGGSLQPSMNLNRPANIGVPLPEPQGQPGQPAATRSGHSLVLDLDSGHPLVLDLSKLQQVDSAKKIQSQIPRLLRPLSDPPAAAPATAPGLNLSAPTMQQIPARVSGGPPARPSALMALQLAGPPAVEAPSGPKQRAAVGASSSAGQPGAASAPPQPHSYSAAGMSTSAGQTNAASALVLPHAHVQAVNSQDALKEAMTRVQWVPPLGPRESGAPQAEASRGRGDPSRGRGRGARILARGRGQQRPQYSHSSSPPSSIWATSSDNDSLGDVVSGAGRAAKPASEAALEAHRSRPRKRAPGVCLPSSSRGGPGMEKLDPNKLRSLISIYANGAGASASAAAATSPAPAAGKPPLPPPPPGFVARRPVSSPSPTGLLGGPNPATAVAASPSMPWASSGLASPAHQGEAPQMTEPSQNVAQRPLPWSSAADRQPLRGRGRSAPLRGRGRRSRTRVKAGEREDWEEEEEEEGGHAAGRRDRSSSGVAVESSGEEKGSDAGDEGQRWQGRGGADTGSVLLAWSLDASAQSAVQLSAGVAGGPVAVFWQLLELHGIALQVVRGDPISRRTRSRLGVLIPPSRSGPQLSAVDASGGAGGTAVPGRGKRKRKTTRPKDGSKQVEGTERSKWQRLLLRVRAQVQRIHQEEHTISVFAADGWRGASREKVRLTDQLRRAQQASEHAKASIRDCVRQCENDNVGHRTIPDHVYDDDGEVDAGAIMCSICDDYESYDDNDIIMCDGCCNRAFHESCCNPPVRIADLAEDEGWLCPACDCKIDILHVLNEEFGMEYDIETPSHEVLVGVSTALLTSPRAIAGAGAGGDEAVRPAARRRAAGGSTDAPKLLDVEWPTDDEDEDYAADGAGRDVGVKADKGSGSDAWDEEEDEDDSSGVGCSSSASGRDSDGSLSSDGSLEEGPSFDGSDEDGDSEPTSSDSDGSREDSEGSEPSMSEDELEGAADGGRGGGKGRRRLPRRSTRGARDVIGDVSLSERRLGHREGHEIGPAAGSSGLSEVEGSEGGAELVLHHKRRRVRVDYLTLHQEMFGGLPDADEGEEEDESMSD